MNTKDNQNNDDIFDTTDNTTPNPPEIPPQKPQDDPNFFDVHNVDDLFDVTAELPKQRNINLDFTSAKPAVPLSPSENIPDDDYSSPKSPMDKAKKFFAENKIFTGILILFVVVLLVVALFINRDKSYKAPEPPQNTTPPAKSETLSSEPSVRKNPDAFTKPTIDKSLWNLLLVNTNHPLSADFTPKTSPIEEAESIDERVLQSYLEMQAAGAAENMNFFACSGYRPFDLQQRLFEEQIDTVMATQNCSKEEATKIAATVVATPGTSEHQTGLAVDIVTSEHPSLDESIKDTPEMQWLYKNARNFGFIVRFPADKHDITGIIYEPWHFRYVGKEAATEISSRNITLEEYLSEN